MYACVKNNKAQSMKYWDIFEKYTKFRVFRVHVVKTRRGNADIAPLILNFVTK